MERQIHDRDDEAFGVAAQGGTTVSNSSLRITSMEQGFWHNGVGLGVGLAPELSAEPDALSFPEAGPVLVIAWEETISPKAPTPVAINKVTQTTFRNRLSANVRLTVSMLLRACTQRLYQHSGPAVNSDVVRRIIPAVR